MPSSSPTVLASRVTTTFSSSPSPGFPEGPRYTLRITFHSATHLPIGDIPSFTSDPYIIATLRFPGTGLPKLHYRTRTQRSTLEPEWNETWGVSNVPKTGALLKVKIMDEDPGDHDDRLGVTRIETGRLDGDANDGGEKQLDRRQTLKTDSGVWVGFLRVATGVVRCRRGGVKGEVEVTIAAEEMQGQPVEQVEDRAYTVSPNRWSQHFSPLIGIITHTKQPEDSENAESSRRPSVQRFSFTATKIQLTGPLPPSLNHRYVAFRPIIKTFYTKSGLLGIVLNRALKHQYRTIYSYGRNTAYGECDSDEDLARKVLEFTHWGEGGRVFTYVITLDGEWRFTETGKEFGIQMLSKHTMHSCVSIYVGFAGEFFVRDLKHESKRKDKDAQKNIDDYELVIDNDSGTYRPPKEHVEALQRFLDRALPKLKVRTADAFDEEHIAMKKAHAEEKASRGRARYKQPSGSRSSSESSSDEEELRSGRIGIGRSIKKKMWKKVERSDDAAVVTAEVVGMAEGLVEGKGKQKEDVGAQAEASSTAAAAAM